MPDWYEKYMYLFFTNPAAYAAFSGHFVDDFGTLVRCYEYDQREFHSFWR